METGPVSLEASQRRALSAALAELDELLCRIEAWAEGRERRAVLYRECNDLSPRQRETLLRQAADARRTLDGAGRKLALREKTILATADIWGRACAIRARLIELGSKPLRAYGEVPPALAPYLDELSTKLLAQTDAIIRSSQKEV